MECFSPVMGWNRSQTVKNTAASISQRTTTGTPPKIGSSTKMMELSTADRGAKTASMTESIDDMGSFL